MSHDCNTAAASAGKRSTAAQTLLAPGTTTNNKSLTKSELRFLFTMLHFTKSKLNVNWDGVAAVTGSKKESAYRRWTRIRHKYAIPQPGKKHAKAAPKKKGRDRSLTGGNENTASATSTAGLNAEKKRHAPAVGGGEDSMEDPAKQVNFKAISTNAEDGKTADA